MTTRTSVKTIAKKMYPQRIYQKTPLSTISFAAGRRESNEIIQKMIVIGSKSFDGGLFVRYEMMIVCELNVRMNSIAMMNVTVFMYWRWKCARRQMTATEMHIGMIETIILVLHSLSSL